MSPRQPGSHSTGSVRAAYVEDEVPYQSSTSSSSTSSEGLSEEGSSWGIIDDIEPSESASHPPRAPSITSHSTRHSTRPVVLEDRHRTTSEPGLSHHSSTTLEEVTQRTHRVRGDAADRRPHRRQTEEEVRTIHRETRARVPSSTSSSTDSYDPYYGGGGVHRGRPHHSDPHGPPHPPAPQPLRHAFAPHNLPAEYDSHGYDANGYPYSFPYDPPMIPMSRYDHLPAVGGGYPAQHNPFGPQVHQVDNPFSPMTSSGYSTPDYFAAQYERPAPPMPVHHHDLHPAHHHDLHPSHHQHDPHPPHHQARPPPRRPPSYAGAPYPGIEHALMPYYAPPLPPQSGFSGYPQGNDPALLAAYLHELKLKDQSLRDLKPKSPPPATSAAEPKKEPKEDPATMMIRLLDEREEKARVAAELKAQHQAMLAAAEKAQKDASDMESAKIAKMLLTWKEEEAKARKAEKEAAKAAQAAVEAQAAQAAAIAAAATAAREAAEKAAAEKAKKMEEETAKKIAEAAEKEAALEKAKKELEENLAKVAPQPDDTKKNVHFHDALNRKYDVPWKYAKTWKGMRGLIEQAFSHVDGIGQNVMEGRYDLLGPEGNIILPAVWEMVIQPGWGIRMELWPELEPDPIVTYDGLGGWTTDAPRKDKGKKKGKGPKKPVSPAMAPVPPPLGSGMHIVDDGGGSSDRSSKAGKGKRRESKPPGFLSAWIEASAGPRPRASGKDSEKPGTMVHHVSPNNNIPIQSTNHDGESQSQQVRRSDSGTESHLHREKRRTTDNEDFLLVSNNERSAAQGKSEQVIEVGCSVM